MNPVTLDVAAVSPDPIRKSATELQAALFTQLLRHGGFAEAFSTGSDTLDSLTDHVLQRVAEDIAAADTRFADRLYQQLRGAEGELP
ncbi:hypothetical protein [Parvularcula lutaonensis]|uniref:Uncharacterized protein n=1 Tax=Parvularcula lutaonensis TaxID=491923 RepID=A0ABV7MBB2_9PROT|nr:hypothetical protein [Parvularcula lutaonensis]